MKKILITGAAGFIGSHLAELCVEKGYSVRALVKYNSRNAWGWLEASPFLRDMEVVSGDVRNFDSVSQVLDGVDTVFHLAALIGIPYSYITPHSYIETNIVGTYNILQGARLKGLESVLVTSTSEVYGTAQYVPIDENHPLSAQSPYAASKIGADQLALSYFRSFELPVTIVRPFNVYGPRQSARAVIPTVITQILAGRGSVRIGRREPLRDLTFVGDTAAAYLAIAESGRLAGEVVNIGRDEEISVGDLALRIASLMGVRITLEVEDERVRPEKSEVLRLRCDNRKLLQAASWKPRFSLDQGLEKTIGWLKDHLDLYKPDIYNA